VSFSPRAQEWARTPPWLARLRADGTSRNIYTPVEASEVLAAVMDNAKIDAAIRALWARRLESTPLAKSLKQVGRRKMQHGDHCVCHAPDDKARLWIACDNKGAAETDRGHCKHATGWFHPECVGLSTLRSPADVAAHGRWACPLCVRPALAVE
jgi:hypothetical protein